MHCKDGREHDLEWMVPETLSPSANEDDADNPDSDFDFDKLAKLK